MNQVIGIYGGTFDPVHYGHLRPVLDVYEKYQLAHIYFIPSSIPPHRQTPECTTEWRLKLLETALEHSSTFSIDKREINRNGPSYMVDTLKSLRLDFPDNSLALILGLDAFLQLPKWYRWQELLDYTNIIVTHRPNSSLDVDLWPDATAKLFQQKQCSEISMLQQSLCGKIFLTEVTQLDISASNIRERIKHNLSIDYLLPDSVKSLIKQHNLYQ